MSNWNTIEEYKEDGTASGEVQSRLLYEMVAIEHQLNDEQKELFIEYMMFRWEDSAEMKCKTGYAAELAHRFKEGIEFLKSDSIGQLVLIDMHPKYEKQWKEYRGIE